MGEELIGGVVSRCGDSVGSLMSVFYTVTKKVFCLRPRGVVLLCWVGACSVDGVGVRRSPYVRE